MGFGKIDIIIELCQLFMLIIMLIIIICQIIDKQMTFHAICLIFHIYFFVAVKNLSESLLYSKKVGIIALKLRSRVFIEC